MLRPILPRGYVYRDRLLWLGLTPSYVQQGLLLLPIPLLTMPERALPNIGGPVSCSAPFIKALEGGGARA